ncbi:MAG: hypothetical protein JW874_10960 [Spirochaetales bacterium]|nr:hypothetical protein [Spirochaetales bacterium]
MSKPTDKNRTINILGRSWRLPPLVIVFFILFLVSQTIIGLIVRPLGSINVLKLQTVFSAPGFAAIIGAWEKSGLLKYYYIHFIPDFLHPIWYGLFLFFLLRLEFVCAGSSILTGMAGRRLKTGLLLLGPVAAGLDIVENVLHLLFLHFRVLVAPFPVFAASLVSSLKWLCAFMALLAAAHILIRILATVRRDGK